jgi:2-C-methyl-D-erythritol 2,4-cyclodiphosphate synthase
MKANIARALGVEPRRVGVKATTNEGMGFVGEGQGMAAYAVAMITSN